MKEGAGVLLSKNTGSLSHQTLPYSKTTVTWTNRRNSIDKVILKKKLSINELKVL